MRVLHIVDGQQLSHELGRHLSLLLRGLIKRGVEVGLLTNVEIPNVTDEVPLLQAENAFAIRRLIKSQKPDLVHLHAPFAMGAMAALIVDVPLIVSYVGRDPDRHSLPLLDVALRARARLVVEMPYGIDLENLDSPDDLGVAALRQAYQQPIAVCMAPWYEGRALVTLLEAWARLGQGTLLLVSASTDETGLRDLVGKLGMTNRVAFLSPPSYERLPNLYHAADVFVQPAPFQGIGMLSLLEAQACGVPTIRAAKQATGDEEGGLVVPPDEVDPLVYALSRLLQDEELRQRLGEQGSALVRRDYSGEPLVEAAMAAYREALPS